MQRAAGMGAGMFQLMPSARLRPSPYYEATVAAGVVSMTVYNRMLMPTSYGSPEEEYWRLIEGVSMWDVAVERQVQLEGPDAYSLAQALCVRDLSKAKVGQGKYVPVCDHDGRLINDPIALKLADDKWWLSIADSDIWFHARAIARERRYDVSVSEPDVSPLAVQGPKAEAVVASIFGDWVRDLKYFWFRETEIDGIPVAVQRSGWSKQGGFEIYLCDGARGLDLWNIVEEAGRPHDIGPGNPNVCERIESGLLSWGGDTDDTTTPFEVRMGAYTDTSVPDDTVGVQALRRVEREGPPRHQLGLVMEGDAPLDIPFGWFAITRDGEPVGHQTNRVWSWRMKRNIGFALVSTDAVAGDTVSVETEAGPVRGELVELPFL